MDTMSSISMPSLHPLSSLRLPLPLPLPLIALPLISGNTLDSHRLLALAGRRDEERERRGEGGASLQNAIVEELFKDYFTRGRYIGDR